MDGCIIINFVHSYLLKHSCKIVTVIWGRRFTSSTVRHLLFNVIVAVPLNGFVNTGFNNFCHICKFKSYVHTHLDHLHFKFASLLIKKKKKCSHYFYIYLLIVKMSRYKTDLACGKTWEYNFIIKWPQVLKSIEHIIC